MVVEALETRVAIETRNLNVWIQEKQILNNVNIKVPRGRITAIMGPSGSGKSTLLRAVNRLLDYVEGAVVEGEVYVDGINVYKSDPYEVRRLIGTVFQEPNPFPHMSIYDNVALPAKVNKVAKNKEELDRVVRWALEKAMLWDEVKDRLRDPPWKLSGGQKQRLCIARALAMKPKVLLLDEPTANIDPVNTLKIEEALRGLRDEGMTIAIVTHMPHQAVRVSDYMVIMYGGRVVEEGPTEEIALSPKHEISFKILRGEV
ncbi:MAG: phosphate ABC transporter ATP-binding protein [Acidilobaceae archaeon]